MDETQTHNRQYRATHINPDLRKAQSDFARVAGLLNIHKNVFKKLHGIIKLVIINLLLQPLLELGSKSTSLSSGFSDVIKATRYDLLIHCLIS